MECVLVGTGAIAGAIARWQITNTAKKYSIEPWTTMGINIAGSFTLGGLYARQSTNGLISSNAYLLLGTGFCGSFTTLSTFSLDAVLMIQKANYGRAATLVLLTNAASMGAAAAAYKFFR